MEIKDKNRHGKAPTGVGAFFFYEDVMLHGVDEE